MSGMVLVGLIVANAVVCVAAIFGVRVDRGRTPRHLPATFGRATGAAAMAAGLFVVAVGQSSMMAPGGNVRWLIVSAAVASGLAAALFAIDGGRFPIGLTTAVGVAWLLAVFDFFVLEVHVAWPLMLAALIGAAFLGVSLVDIWAPTRRRPTVRVTASAGPGWRDDLWPDQQSTTTTSPWPTSEEDDW